MTKYLPDFGWEPTIYTPENPDFSVKDNSLAADAEKIRVIKTKIWEPYSLLPSSKKKNANIGFTKADSSKKISFKQKIIQWIRGNIFIPDPRVHWVKPSIKYLKKVINEERFDAIVSTGPPHSMHMIALGLHKSLGIPWVADFRDPFSQMDVYDAYFLNKRSRSKLEKIEQEILDNCSAFVSTSFSIADFLLKIDSAKMHVVTNGYDAENFVHFKDRSREDSRIVIFHGGTLGEERNPIGFLKALKRLKKERKELFDKIELRLAGKTAPAIVSELKKFLGPQLLDLGYLDHSSLLAEYEKASILLLLVHKTDIGRTCIPGKIYEYLATQKPILGFGHPKSDSAMILEKTQGGLIFDYKDDTATYQGLLQLLEEPEKYACSNASLKEFERRALCEKYSSILNELIHT